MPSSTTWPPIGYADCPWLQPEVELILRKAIDGRLYAYFNNWSSYGWFDDTPQRAYPAGHEVSELMRAMEKKGHLTWGSQVLLTDESGESFTGDRMELTASGRELYDRLTLYLNEMR